MKTTSMKVAIASAILLSGLMGNGLITNAATTKPAVTTAAPVITDNFSKYDMTKTQSLPATINADGLSYTLHKALILDVNSKEAQTIWKTYKFLPLSLYSKAKYLIWTKITITNNTTQTIRRDMKDLNSKWRVSVDIGNGNAPLLTSGDPYYPYNSKECLGDFILKPNESLTTYEAYYAKVKPRHFFVSLINKKTIKVLYLVDPDGIGK